MKKINLVVLFIILFTSCKFEKTITISGENKTQSKSQDAKVVETNTTILDAENESYKVEIKKVKRSDFSKFTNSHSASPFLGMKAECISLEEFIGVLKSIESSPIIMENKNLDDPYYSVFISQNTIDSVQENKMKRAIIKALKFNIEEKIFKIDTTIVSMRAKKEFMKHANKVVSDTIKTISKISHIHMEFENMLIEDIMTSLGEKYNKVFVLKVKESQRINLSLKGNNWVQIKTQLESYLGLSFNTYTTEQKKFLITN